MISTFLTQHDLEKIPQYIYKKIEHHFDSIIDQSNKYRELNTQNTLKIQDLTRQLLLLTDKIKDHIWIRYNLEIENEGLKLQTDILKNSINILYDNTYIDENTESISTNTSNITEEKLKKNTDNHINIISKLIKKIKNKDTQLKELKKNYKIIESKFKLIQQDYINKLKEIFNLQMYNIELLQKCKFLDVYYNIKKDYESLQKSYDTILRDYNKLQFDFNVANDKYNDIFYKYNRYIATNRDDIVPVIGIELDKIKLNLIKFFDSFNEIDNPQIIFNEYKNLIISVKNLNEKLKNDIYKIEICLKDLLIDIFEKIDTIWNMFGNIKSMYNLIINYYKKELEQKNKFIFEITESQSLKHDNLDINILLLEIYRYKKEITKIKDEKTKKISDFEKKELNFNLEIDNLKNRIIFLDEEICSLKNKLEIKKNENETEHQTENILHHCFCNKQNNGMPQNKDNKFDENFTKKCKFCLSKDEKINILEIKLSKFLIIFNKFQKIKEEYINLKIEYTKLKKEINK